MVHLEEEALVEAGRSPYNPFAPFKASTINTLLVLIIIFSLFIIDAGAQDTSKLKLVFAGDIMGHDSQILAAYDAEKDKYDYTECFRHLKPYLQEADIAIGNLEVTLAGPPYKGYPQFASPDALADALKDAGFDILVNANNHALDRGKQGLERTLDVLDQKGLISSGSFESVAGREKRYPLLVEKNDIMLALLNYTYGTNGIEPDTPNIINYIDTLMIREDISKVKQVDPDFIIACIHWGREYERTEHSTQKDLAEFLFKEGVDAIIGSHPHVIQPVRHYYPEPDSSRFKLVVYSLGNMVSNQRDRYRNGGILFEMVLIKAKQTSIGSYAYLPVWVNKPEQKDKTVFQLIPANISESQKDSLSFSDASLDQFNQFYEDTRIHLENIPESQFFKDYSFR